MSDKVEIAAASSVLACRGPSVRRFLGGILNRAQRAKVPLLMVRGKILKILAFRNKFLTPSEKSLFPIPFFYRITNRRPPEIFVYQVFAYILYCKTREISAFQVKAPGIGTEIKRSFGGEEGKTAPDQIRVIAPDVQAACHFFGV